VHRQTVRPSISRAAAWGGNRIIESLAEGTCALEASAWNEARPIHQAFDCGQESGNHGTPSGQAPVGS
jgi:hypothetical protein